MIVISPEGAAVSGLSSEYLTVPRDVQLVSLERERADEVKVRPMRGVNASGVVGATRIRGARRITGRAGRAAQMRDAQSGRTPPTSDRADMMRLVTAANAVTKEGTSLRGTGLPLMMQPLESLGWWLVRNIHDS